MKTKTILAGAFGVLAVALFFGPLSDFVGNLNGERILGWLDGAGGWGPVLIIALMAIAIVATPIPSAPIAVAAGAAYGHTQGTIYIVLGAGSAPWSPSVLPGFWGAARSPGGLAANWTRAGSDRKMR